MTGGVGVTCPLNIDTPHAGCQIPCGGLRGSLRGSVKGVGPWRDSQAIDYINLVLVND